MCIIDHTPEAGGENTKPIVRVVGFGALTKTTNITI